MHLLAVMSFTARTEMGGTPHVLQVKSDYARHEAFCSLFNVSTSLKDDQQTPELVLVGVIPSVLPQGFGCNFALKADSIVSRLTRPPPELARCKGGP